MQALFVLSLISHLIHGNPPSYCLHSINIACVHGLVYYPGYEAYD